MPGLLEQLDGSISAVLEGWNIYTTLIAAGILGFIGWIIYDTADADTHPLLLARQAQASYVRQPGESAIFRSPETPHGCKQPIAVSEYCMLTQQTLSAPALPSSLRALQCTLLEKTAIFGTSGDALPARFLSKEVRLRAAQPPS